MFQFPSHFQQKKIQTQSFVFHFVKVGFFFSFGCGGNVHFDDIVGVTLFKHMAYVETMNKYYLMFSAMFASHRDGSTALELKMLIKIKHHDAS